MIRNRRIFGAGICVIAALALNLTSQPGNADPGNGVEQRLAALEQKVTMLQTQNSTLQSQVTSLQTSLAQETADRKAGDAAAVMAANSHADAGDAATLSAAKQYAAAADTVVLTAAQQSASVNLGPLQEKTQFISVNGTEMIISGANLNIVNGLGHTDSANGLGNLILGYNKVDPAALGANRSGSHNLVIGDEHSYTSHSGVVSGFNNEIGAPFACVSGGSSNFASAEGASVTGGEGNVAKGPGSSISGGSRNTAWGFECSISGGDSNNAIGDGSSITGGEGNVAGGLYGVVSGGLQNSANGALTSVGGGNNNLAAGDGSVVSGGDSINQLTVLGWSAGSFHTP